MREGKGRKGMGKERKERDGKGRKGMGKEGKRWHGMARIERDNEDGGTEKKEAGTGTGIGTERNAEMKHLW